ncbi:hypothetical protein [Planctomyces sp. SH-PL62]|uniref:hypothetical protein n=1 Tax=Planctomyces sp. SH-PL62 TaxID=1636152 RepID=UPI00078D4E31|nr:hypothetical protein [Planctomyces sp. SH-PL62]AMV39506.1 hypothetical protein VT85_18855 [Planctomyces sp. SH-PL62]
MTPTPESRRRHALRPFATAIGLLLATTCFAIRANGQEAVTAVEPADLTRRDDLVGKLVLVDDRIRFFQNHPRVGYDELYLKRTPLAFRLPEELRPDTPPRNPAVVVQGRLVREGSRLYVDVTGLNLQPADLERLDKAVAALSARDFAQRREWGRWAAKRARDFGDGALGARAKAVEAEALRIEADGSRGTVDAADEWLTLAKQGRKQGVAEPDPSALAHRAFRSMLGSAKSPAELEKLKGEVEGFFPDAARPVSGPVGAVAALRARYDQDPAATYRAAPAELRKPLDRELWSDVVEKWLSVQVAQDVPSALRVVDQAAALVPDRPELAARLIDQVRTRAQATLPSLRLSDVKTIGALLTDRAKEPGAAIDFYRDWLKARRDRLSETDAEGPIALAALYDELLHDSDQARELLERAWKIAPGSNEVTEAFKLRGYRRAGDEWIKDSPNLQAAATPPPVEGEQGLRGKTPAEVRAVMGLEPSSKTIVATKGRVILQWVFVETRQRRYVNFLYVPGSQNPRVASDFFLPR